MRLSMRLRLVLWACALGSIACGASVPTPAEEGRVDDYGAALERCKEDAKARDADVDDYRRCKAQVNRDYGRGDGGL